MNNATTIETVVSEAVEAVYAHNSGREPGAPRQGVREVALMVEEQIPDVTLEEIHAVLVRVAIVYPCDDPQALDADRQYSFGLPLSDKREDRRVWVFPKR